MKEKKANRDYVENSWLDTGEREGRTPSNVPTVEERPSPHREPAYPAWVHRIYFGTGRNAGLAVEKGQDVLEAARTFITYRADRLFDGYTLSEAHGHWQGESEHTFLLDIITSQRDQYAEAIAELAKLYKARFKQDAVIVTHTKVWTEVL